MKNKTSASHASSSSYLKALLLAISMMTVTAAAAGEPCEPHWKYTIGAPGMNSSVFALTTAHGMDEGPVLYAGGEFTMAGGISANRIARWDTLTETWSALGTGMSDYVRAMVVFDDDTGGGPALFAGGQFDTAGDLPANRIAKWDGSSWSPLGIGTNGTVQVLAGYDDGNGPALYAGGTFTTAGGITVNRIARWNGMEWSALGTGLNGPVFAMAVFDDGSGTGPALFVGGNFTSAGGMAANRIAKWDGDQWSALGSGAGATVRALATYNDGNGEALYALGTFNAAGGVLVNLIAKWDGQQWSALGNGIHNTGGCPCCNICFQDALIVFDDGSGDALYASGFFWGSGFPNSGLRKWNGKEWAAIESIGRVRALAVLNGQAPDGGNGLYAGGSFTNAGGNPAHRIAKWQGCAKEPKCAFSDLDCNGSVGVQDLLILLSEWGECADCENCPADLTDNCNVGVADLLILLANWG